MRRTAGTFAPIMEISGFSSYDCEWVALHAGKTSLIRTRNFDFPDHIVGEAVRCSASELTAPSGRCELVGPDVGHRGSQHRLEGRSGPGQLYAPIVGPSAMAHAFIPAALEAGAAAYLTGQEPAGGTAIRVRDQPPPRC